MVRSRLWAVVGAALIFGACSDQRERTMEPHAGPVVAQTMSVSDIRATIIGLVPEGYRGGIQGQFGKIENELNQASPDMAVVEAEALEFQRRLLLLLQQGVLTPTPPMTAEMAVLQLLNAVFGYAGLTDLVLPQPGPDVDFFLGLVDQNTNTQLITSPEGFAAMIVGPGSFPGLTFVAIVKRQSTFLLPPAFTLVPPVYDFSASSQPIGGVTVSICPPGVENPNKHWMFHEKVEGQPAEKLEPRLTGHACPEDAHTHASIFSGGSAWARGLNSAGSFLSSVFVPRNLYAGHAGIAGSTTSLSDFGVGVENVSYTVAPFRTNDKGSISSTGLVTFQATGDMVLWITVTRDGDTAPGCYGPVTGRAVYDRAGAQGAETAAESCAPTTVGGVTRSAYKLTFTNPRNNTASTGQIHVTVDGTAAENTIPFRTVR